MNANVEGLAAALDHGCDGPLFVHSDLLGAHCYVGKRLKRHELLATHLNVLEHVAGGRPVWMPCFNYDYTKTRFIDLREAPCQLGPLAEFMRQLPDVWRSTDPVFSVCGNGEPFGCVPDERQVAFGDRSVFAELYRRDATLLFYGASFSSATAIHYAEFLSGGPIYRYDKVFSGQVIDNDGTKHQLDYVYHVRPWGRDLDYHWPRITAEAVTDGIIREVRTQGRLSSYVVPIRRLIDYWVAALDRDPFYLLNESSLTWVQPHYQVVGRRFDISEFERV